MNSTNSPFAQTKFNYLIGPTCVGKGFILKLLDRVLTHSREQNLTVGCISFGQIIRDLMKRDADFRRKHEQTIKRGDLLDDPAAIELFSGKLGELSQEGPFDLMFVDGFCRTVPQVTHAADLGLLRRQDTIFVIEASLHVCAERFTHRNEHDSSRLEREMPTFQKRYHLHADNVGQLKTALRMTAAGENIREIDANRSIPEFAFPSFMSHLLPVISDLVSKRARQDEIPV